jgi:hypothetical protein
MTKGCIPYAYESIKPDIDYLGLNQTANNGGIIGPHRIWHIGENVNLVYEIP